MALLKILVLKDSSFNEMINKILWFIQVHAVVGVLSDDADPMVTVMKLEKAPQESYADIGGLDQQIQEIKVHMQLIYCLVNLPVYMILYMYM